MARSAQPSVVAPLIRKELLRYWNDSQLSQEEVAARLGISRRGLQFIIQGKRRPGGATSVILLARLAPSKARQLLDMVRVHLGALAVSLVFCPALQGGGLA